MQFIQGILVIGLMCFVHISTAQNDESRCESTPTGDELSDMASDCTKKMREQVQVELTASMTYMAMGAYFSRDTVNRPGFAKMFFESAREERDHAIKIISYLLMRGELINNMGQLINNPKPKDGVVEGLTAEKSGMDALKAALQLEYSVTKDISSIIEICEESKEAAKKKAAAAKSEGAKLEGGQTKKTELLNDYHLVDYLTSDFLDEQYKGQREIAGRIETLHKLTHAHGYDLGEFLFDKKLLNGQPL